MRPIHTCDIIGPQEKLRKEIGGLEGRGEGLGEVLIAYKHPGGLH